MALLKRDKTLKQLFSNDNHYCYITDRLHINPKYGKKMETVTKGSLGTSSAALSMFTQRFHHIKYHKAPIFHWIDRLCGPMDEIIINWTV
jgi:hypothetical protein